MRGFDETPIRTRFSRTSPQEFSRQLLNSESETYQAFNSMIDRANGITEALRQTSKAHQVYYVPVLEDNLTTPAYRQVRDLLRDRTPSNVIVVRNAEQLPIDSTLRTSNEILEIHRIDASSATSLSSHGPLALSLDGQGYLYPGESPEGISGYPINFEEFESLLQSPDLMSLQYVLLWRPEWQGLLADTQLTHPSDRRYRAPTEEERQQIITLLRSGLSDIAL
jgi:3',5'-cyclic AMP phosphodiesterase CpdA